MVIESHRRDIDLQVILSGKEHIKIYSEDQVECIDEYNSQTDCQFYDEIKRPDLELDLTPGKMALFFPQDIHGCQHAINQECITIKKVVFKIDEKFFSYKK